MTALLKQRLVGAIVLISLGIIFIPMLLTGTDSLTMGDLPTNIPPKPLYEIQAPAVLPMERKSHAEPVMEPAPDSKPAANNADNSLVSADEPASSAENVVASNSAEKPVTGTSSEMTNASPAGKAPEVKATTGEQGKAVAAIEPASELTKPVITDQSEKLSTPPSTADSDAKSKQEPKPAAKSSTAKLETTKPIAKSTAQPATKPATKPPIVNGWVVQLGSFSVEKNALKLRDKLRKNGHASFVEEYEKQGKTTYRVRVGPELTRELAGKLKTQLKKETRIDGLIMAFPGK